MERLQEGRGSIRGEKAGKESPEWAVSQKDGLYVLELSTYEESPNFSREH